MGFYKERHKLSLTNKTKLPKNLFYWCQQDEWEKAFKEQLESKFSVVKKKAWADQIKSFKSSNTYKSCPGMVIWVVEFSREGYNFGKYFRLKINMLKGNY